MNHFQMVEYRVLKATCFANIEKFLRSLHGVFSLSMFSVVVLELTGA